MVSNLWAWSHHTFPAVILGVVVCVMSGMCSVPPAAHPEVMSQGSVCTSLQLGEPLIHWTLARTRFSQDVQWCTLLLLANKVSVTL